MDTEFITVDTLKMLVLCAATDHVAGELGQCDNNDKTLAVTGYFGGYI